MTRRSFHPPEVRSDSYDHRLFPSGEKNSEGFMGTVSPQREEDTSSTLPVPLMRGEDIEFTRPLPYTHNTHPAAKLDQGGLKATQTEGRSMASALPSTRSPWHPILSDDECIHSLRLSFESVSIFIDAESSELRERASWTLTNFAGWAGKQHERLACKHPRPLLSDSGDLFHREILDSISFFLSFGQDARCQFRGLQFLAAYLGLEQTYFGDYGGWGLHSLHESVLMDKTLSSNPPPLSSSSSSSSSPSSVLTPETVWSTIRSQLLKMCARNGSVALGAKMIHSVIAQSQRSSVDHVRIIFHQVYVYFMCAHGVDILADNG